MLSSCKQVRKKMQETTSKMTFWSTLLRAQLAKMKFWSTPFTARVAKEETNQKPTRGIEFLEPPGVVFGEPFWGQNP